MVANKWRQWNDSGFHTKNSMWSYPLRPKETHATQHGWIYILQKDCHNHWSWCDREDMDCLPPSSKSGICEQFLTSGCLEYSWILKPQSSKSEVLNLYFLSSMQKDLTDCRPLEFRVHMISSFSISLKGEIFGTCKSVSIENRLCNKYKFCLSRILYFILSRDVGKRSITRKSGLSRTQWSS